MKKILEWVLNLFISYKKANNIKQEAFIERQKAIAEYEKAKLERDKYLKKYSKKSGFIKTGNNNNK